MQTDFNFKQAAESSEDLILNVDSTFCASTGRVSEEASRETPHILLVEDGELNQKLAVALLSKAGINQVSIANNGEIGLQKACEENYDIILMDMQMPVMDGYTATKELRKLGHKTPIIALTANAMKENQEKCLAAGCTDYLSKPIHGADLLGKIFNLLPQYEAKEPTSQNSISDHHNEIPESEKLETTLPICHAIFLEIVQDFGVLLNQKMQELQNAVEKQDRTHIKQLAHDLAGTAGGAGFEPFTDPSRHLESIAEVGRLEDIKETVEVINHLFFRVFIPEAHTEPVMSPSTN